jgi:hypothetical protein
MHPYQGGSLTLTVIFSQVQRENVAGKVLDVVESFSDIVNPIAPTISFSSYIKIARNVMNGVNVLMGLDDTKPIIAFQETINPDIADQKLEPTYLVLIDTPAFGDTEKGMFRVKDGKLFYGSTDENAAPYRTSDFVLLEIAQANKRTDEQTLDFYPQWEQTLSFGEQSAIQNEAWEQAKHNLNALWSTITKSPDLTKPDKERFKQEYLDELKRKRTEGAELADLTIEQGSLDFLDDLKSLDKNLDELDEL